MGALRKNTDLAEWAWALKQQPDGTELSYRTMEQRTGVHYSTVMRIVEGRSVNAGDIILFAHGFGQHIPTALRLAEHHAVADIWEAGATARQKTDEQAPKQ